VEGHVNHLFGSRMPFRQALEDAGVSVEAAGGGGSPLSVGVSGRTPDGVAGESAGGIPVGDLAWWMGEERRGAAGDRALGSVVRGMAKRIETRRNP
jgi:hypothetical protein